MNQDRKYKRRIVSDYFLISNRETDQLLGRIGNLSIGGLMLVSTEGLQVGQKYPLKLKLPRETLGKDEVVFDAFCRWSTYNDIADWWESGLEMHDLSIEAFDLLQYLTQQLMKDEQIERGLSSNTRIEISESEAPARTPRSAAQKSH